MTVEFLDSVDPDDPAIDQRPTDRRGRFLDLTDVVLSLAGVALLVFACFRDIFSIRVEVDSELTGYAVDGWGRLHDAGGLESGQHAPRLGIVFCVAAGLALVGLALRRSRDGLRRVGSALATTATGAALAMVGDGVLSGLATYDSYHRATIGDDSDPVKTLEPHLGFGGFVWLGAVGAVCVLLAVALPALARIRRPRQDAAPAGPAAVIDEGEQLG